jgi:hypothetical protein
LTQHLTVIDEVEGRCAEFGFAACETWARPVENAVFESKCGAYRSGVVRDGERLVLDVEVCRYVAAIDTHELAAADIVLACRRWIGRRVAV